METVESVRMEEKGMSAFRELVEDMQTLPVKNTAAQDFVLDLEVSTQQVHDFMLGMEWEPKDLRYMTLTSVARDLVHPVET